MKAHVVPEFYLKGFTDSDTPNGQEPYVWRYSFEESRWRPRAPRNVATKLDYYIVKDAEGNRHTGFEDALSRVETMAAPLIRNKITQRAELDDSDREIFALFVAMMEARLPDRIERFGDFMTKIGRMMIARYRQAFQEDPRYLETFKRQYREETGKRDLDDLTTETLNPDYVDIQANRAAVLAALFRGTETAVEYLLRMGWDFLVTSPPNWYITSDDPCARVDAEDLTGPYSAGFANPNLEITMPLTARVALCATWESEGVRYIDVPPNLVLQTNLRTVLHAKEFIASPNQRFPGEDHVLEFISQKRPSENGESNSE